jgi:hypothetical protein
MGSVAGRGDASAVSLQPTELHPQFNGSLAGPGWRVVERVDRAEFERRCRDSDVFLVDGDELEECWDVYQACVAFADTPPELLEGSASRRERGAHRRTPGGGAVSGVELEQLGGTRSTVILGLSKDGDRYFRFCLAEGTPREELDRLLSEALRLEREVT